MHAMRRAWAIVAVGLGASACSYTLPSVPEQAMVEAESSIVRAADGTVLAVLHAEENRESVALSEVPHHVEAAVLAAEDQNFFRHHGIDVSGLLRAMRSNVAAGDIQEGGSTISQQYVKNAILERSDQTLRRKVREALLTLSLEQSYTKEEILAAYLNTVYFGRNAYGVEAAAKQYLGKRAVELTVGEAAFLAALIRAPEAVDPWVDPAAMTQRRNEVVDQMLTIGSISQETADAAKAEALTLADPNPPAADPYPAPYFVEAVKQWLLDDPRFGPTALQRYRLLFGGGLEIHTTVDLRLQQLAEEAIAAQLTAPERDPSAALVALEPATGYVRAMVGGRDFFAPDPTARFNLATQGGRQAGSAFKPLVLAAALEAGIPLATEYPAPPDLQIPLPFEQVWQIQNYDGSGGEDAVNLVEATVRSYNTVYAQLIMQLGPQRAVEAAARFGIRSPLEAVPSAVLGANSVTVLDMVSAFATFANRGVAVEPAFVTRVTSRNGSVLFQHTPVATPVLDPGIADGVTAVLEQAVQRGTGTRANIGRPVAGKTGTAQEWRDAWFVGYTPDLATAVWVGFPQAQVTMRPPATPIRVTGGSWPAEIWNRFMSSGLANVPPRPFVPPPMGMLPPPPQPGTGQS